MLIRRPNLTSRFASPKGVAEKSQSGKAGGSLPGRRVLNPADPNTRMLLTEQRDKKIMCVDCRQEFVWTADEQKFYADKGFTNEPKRCRDCRSAKKIAGGGARDNSRNGARASRGR